LRLSNEGQRKRQRHEKKQFLHAKFPPKNYVFHWHSASFYRTEAYNKAGRDPEIVAFIAIADAKEVKFRPNVIGLEQPDREPVADSLYVDSAAERECEACVSDVTGDCVVIYFEARHPEQGVGERLNPLALSQRELWAEQKQCLVLIGGKGADS
jgi:hypothetical protein